MTRSFNYRFVRPAAAPVVVTMLVLFVVPASADWRDWLNAVTGNEEAATTAAALSRSEIADGLREALGEGVRNAVSQLGRENGFLDNAAVRIPVPEHLGVVEKGLRAIGQDAIADGFVDSLNHAAERAVPAAAEVFAGAISTMSIDDARGILDGGDTAATEYLRRTSSDDLRQRFMPIVDGAVRETDVTARYQALLDKAGSLSSLINPDRLDLSGYVTDRALDGLFVVLGNEERKIRENPAARTTELLKKVFGS